MSPRFFLYSLARAFVGQAFERHYAWQADNTVKACIARFINPHFLTMTLTFNARAFFLLLLITAVEVMIAIWGRPFPLLRGFFGDVIAVGWAYLVFATVIRAPVLQLALAGLFTGYAVEFGQYLAALYGWKIQQPVLRIVLGSVADWWDVLAYTLGFFLVLAIELARRDGPLPTRLRALTRLGD